MEQELKQKIESAVEIIFKKTGVVQPMIPCARTVEEFMDFIINLPPIRGMSDAEAEIYLMQAKRFHDALNSDVYKQEANDE